ncbi:tctex1 domain-containing 2 [Chlorella sorokiniana]|uniref:Tctex1 domain-containing 2 n=1 Tax=Chlorella sorokiniana TaxID=3076 RepID=A0A2P6TUU2_CHLSO|nr:tctex1 domain-containing 2 [Chlorella sorokiniana]|eukprot:PRW57837.1 tctex1 domain-containing 2 [Chlorella sorokiniana]
MALLDDAPLRQTVWENTYRLPEQLEPEARFRQQQAQRVLRELLAERLAGVAYDPVRMSQLTKQLADDIRERVKALGLERHKLVVHVLCGERKGQALHSSSRCLWDTASDGWASETFLNETLFCTAQVFALCFE